MTPTHDAALDIIQHRFDSVKTRLIVFASPGHRRFKENDDTVRLYRAAKEALAAVLRSGTNDDLVAADRAITALDDHVENKVGLNPTTRSNRTGTEQQPTPAVDPSTMSDRDLLVGIHNALVRPPRRSLFGGRGSTSTGASNWRH